MVSRLFTVPPTPIMAMSEWKFVVLDCALEPPHIRAITWGLKQLLHIKELCWKYTKVKPKIFEPR